MANPIEQATRKAKATGGHKSATLADLLAPFRSGTREQKDWDASDAIEAGYKANTWVFRAVRAKMDNAAKVPIMVRERAAEDEFEPAPGHPLQQLLDRPNPFMSRQDLIERLVAHIELSGNALWSKVRGNSNGVVGELWPLNPDPISVIPSKQEFIAEYRWEKEGVRKSFEPENIVHFRYTDPENPRWGMGPIQAAAQAVDSDAQALDWQMNSFDHRAVPDGAFMFQGVGKEQFEAARQQIRNEYSGPQNSRKPLVLAAENGVEWIQMALSPAEMDFLETRKFTREEIATAFGVPLPILGTLEDVTLANYETARKDFWQDTMLPLLAVIRETIQRTLVPEFADQPGELKVQFDTSGIEVLHEGRSDKIEQLTSLVESGVPLNRAIEFLELPLEPVDGGDTGFVGSNRVPMDFLASGIDREAL